MSLTNMHDPALERGRLCMVIATIVINVIAVSLLTFAPWSNWRTGAALNFVDNCMLVGFAVVRRDALLVRFLLFGVLFKQKQANSLLSFALLARSGAPVTHRCITLNSTGVYR